MPFADLPEKKSAHQHAMTEDVMAKSVWVKPEQPVEVEFVERTPHRRLRPRFIPAPATPFGGQIERETRRLLLPVESNQIESRQALRDTDRRTDFKNRKMQRVSQVLSVEAVVSVVRGSSMNFEHSGFCPPPRSSATDIRASRNSSAVARFVMALATTIPPIQRAATACAFSRRCRP
jgi:hypothetical protein